MPRCSCRPTLLPSAAVLGAFLFLDLLGIRTVGLASGADAAGVDGTSGSIRVSPGATISLAVAPPTATGKAAPTIIVLGAPQGARITDGSHQVITQEDDEAINTTGWDLPKLAIQWPTGATGHFIISAFAIPPEAEGAPRPESLLNLVLDVQPGPGPVASNETRERRRDPPKAPREGSPNAEVVIEGRSAAKTAIPGLGHPTSLEPASASLGAKTEDPRDAQPGARSGPPSVPGRTPQVASTKDEGGRLSVRSTASPGPETAAPDEAAPLGARSEPNATTLIERAQGLIRLGDVSGGRLVLERAVARGDPRAAFLLAQTYDPDVLRNWNVRGMQADPERARQLYALAEKGGIKAAKVIRDVTR